MRAVIERLQARRLNVWEQAKALLDAAEADKRDLTAEEEQTYQRLSGDLDTIDERVKTLVDAEQRAADAEAAFAKLLGAPADPSKGNEDRNAELRAWLSGESGRVFEIRADKSTPRSFQEFRAAHVKGTNNVGGYTVPQGFYGRLVEHMIEMSGVMMAGPTLLRTDSGEKIPVPKTTAHVAPSGAPVGENAQISESNATFGSVDLDAYKYPVLLTMSNELITDTAVDLEGYLARSAGRALGNWFGAHLVTGTGSGQPNGVVTAATTGVTGAAAKAGAFTADDIIDLFYSVIAPYRNSPSCGWLLRDTSIAAARKLKNSNGDYLWQPALIAGTPDMLLSKPVHPDPNVPAIEADAKSVVFGDFSAYFVRHVNTIRFERSDDFKFDYDVVTYRAIIRADGDLVDTSGAVKVFKGGAAA